MPPDVGFKGYNAPKSISARALLQTPLGEFTALLQASLLDLRGPTSKGKEGVRGRGWVSVGKGNKNGEGARERKEGRTKRKQEREKGREEREREGDTRYTNPSLLPAPLRTIRIFLAEKQVLSRSRNEPDYS